MNLTILIVILLGVYVLRIISYLVWLYVKTEQTIKSSEKFEHKSNVNSPKVLFIGDSLTFGAGASNANKTIAGLFHADNPDYTVINQSINKITTKDLVPKLSELINSQDKYEATVLSIGGNDIVQLRSMKNIEKRVEHIVGLLKSVSGAVYVFTPTKPGKSPLLIKLLIRSRVKRLRNIITSMSGAKVHHIDMWDAGDELLAKPEKYFVEDTLHLSDEGQLAWYLQLKKEITM